MKNTTAPSGQPNKSNKPDSGARKAERRRRMPAEWENPRRILVAFPMPGTDWDYILKEAREQFKRLVDTLLEAGESVVLIADKETERRFDPHPNLKIITQVPYNDTWTRDYGPITVEEDGRIHELHFGFNGWGLKFPAYYDNLVTLDLTMYGGLDPDRYENRRDYILEGGSIESDGKGTILTTTRCLCDMNRNGGKSQPEVERILGPVLGAGRFLWLQHGYLEGDDTDSHIDTLARMAPDDTIIYVAPPEDCKDLHRSEMEKMECQLKTFRTAEGRPYRLIPLPFPDPIYDEDGLRLPATYANYLVTGRNLFIPTYAQPEKDAEAVRQIASAFPAHKVYSVDCRTLIKQHGSLHCSTMQLY